MSSPRTASRGLGLTRALGECPVKDGFQLRGCDMTRLEAFTDAAFAFALTLLVVSASDVPSTVSEMLNAMRGIPAFLVSFTMLVMFWGGHWRWSRRYGLEDFQSIVLSFLLIFIVLCYVYPLRYMFGLFMHFLSQGFLSADATIQEPGELYAVFAVYAIGFVAMCASVLLLNLHAWRHREALALNELERFDTRVEMESWLIMIAAGVLSLILAAVTSPGAMGIPAWAYAPLAIVMPCHGIWRDRERKRIRARQDGT